MKQDFYDVLGVNYDASKDEIKQAFRKLAKQYHPSVSDNPESEEIFKVVNAAYQVLSDNDKRNLYDIHGHDYLNHIKKERGNDILAGVTLTFEEAAFGVEKEVHFQRFEVCTQCLGTGTIIDQRCSTCNGQGRQRNQAKTLLPFPPGTLDGIRIRVIGEGDYLNNESINGDVYVVVRVESHDKFKLEKQDILFDVEISQEQAIEGDTIKIPTLDGEIDLFIPPNTSHGQSFRLAGLGIPRLRSDGSTEGRGDQIVKINVEGMNNGFIQQLFNLFNKNK